MKYVVHETWTGFAVVLLPECYEMEEFKGKNARLKAQRCAENMNETIDEE